MINISFLNLRVIKENSGRYDVNKKIQSPKDIFDVVQKVIKANEYPEENLWLITLDTKNNITGIFTVSIGSLNSSIVHPREVFKRAVLQNAASIIICHNHPSGDPTPSQEDINITKRLYEAGKILGIELLDHINEIEGNPVLYKEKVHTTGCTNKASLQYAKYLTNKYGKSLFDREVYLHK